jgi:uncharacterized protein VirK/YbjX
MYLDSLRKTTGCALGLYSQPKYKLRALGFALHAAVRPRAYGAWFKILESLPETFRYIDLFRLAGVPSRPYLRRWFGVRDRMKILETHYRTVEGRLTTHARRSLSRPGGILLAELPGRDGRRYLVTLLNEFVKEGETTLSFLDAETGASLARLRGSFGPDARGKTVFWIGGLMGARQASGREDIRLATRDLNGLRPKHALMHALAALCEWAGVEAVHAPSARNHIAHRWWRALFPNRKIHADYEGFWREFTAERTPEGDFHLRLPLARRDLDEVQPRRRNEWKKRYARVAALRDDCSKALALSIASDPC